MNINQKKAGVIISYIGQMVNILTGFIYTPIMLKILGQSEYGLYQLVYSVVSYLGLLSLGFGSSYMRFYAREKARKDENGIARLNGMFLIIFGAISIICIICGIIMLSQIHAIFGSGMTEAEYSIAKVLMMLMIINLALTFPNSVFNCIVTSQEKFLFQKSLILIQYILNPFLTLPILLLGGGTIGMVMVTTILTLGVLVTNIYYCLAKIKAKFIFKNLKLSLLKEMWVFTVFIFINQIVDQINWSVDKFLLGRLTGTASVAIYGVGGQINNLYLQFSNSVSNVFIPKVNKIVAESNDDEQLTKLFTKVGRIQFIVVALILSGFTFYGKTFIYFWAGSEYKESYYVALLLIFPVTVPLIQNLGVEIQRAKNKHKARSIVYFIIAIANVFISIPLIEMFGSIGAALGTTISLTVGNIVFMNWYYHYRLGLNIVYFWKSIVRFIPALIPTFIFGIVSTTIFNCNSFWKFVIEVIEYTIVYCISMFFLGLNSEEKAMIMPFVRRVLKK